MPGPFGDPSKRLVSEIFNIAAVLMRKGGLKVPRYQRAYTWTEREVRELIEDLRRAFKRDAPFYFIGQIVLIKHAGKYEISDGQQRLATLSMLIAYVRDRLPGRAKQYQQLLMDGDTPRLTLRDEDNSFFWGFVQEAGKMKELAHHEETGVESKDRLSLAALTIESELTGNMDDRELDNFFSFVAQKCLLNVVDASDRGCAQTVFNTLNKRGSPLSGADIIKSDLLENSGLSDAKANEAARKWEELEDKFEREDFAKLLYMMPFLLTGEKLTSPDDLATFRKAVQENGGVENFLLERLPRYANVLRAIFDCSIDVGPASAEVNRRVHTMKQVEVWDWAPALIAFLVQYRDDPDRARRFVRALDRFTFACELSAVDNRLQEGRYARAMKFCADDRQLYGPKGALELTEVEQLKFIASLKRSRKRDRQRRLLLIRLEAALPGGHLLSMTDNVTVEHILPRAGGAEWNVLFSDSARRAEVSNFIGNQTLITHEQNKEAGQKPFAEKRKILFQFKGNPPIHAITQDIANVKAWTLEEIDERQQRLVGLLCEDWDLNPAATDQAA